MIEPKHRRRRERRQQISSLQIVFISIISIGLLLAINFSSRIRQGQLTTDVREQIEVTISALEAEQIELKQELAFAQSDASVERWAHSQGKLVREGEVLVIPVPGNPPVIPQATPTPLPITTPTPNIPVWELWWSLFFDSEPPR